MRNPKNPKPPKFINPEPRNPKSRNPKPRDPERTLNTKPKNSQLFSHTSTSDPCYPCAHGCYPGVHKGRLCRYMPLSLNPESPNPKLSVISMSYRPSLDGDCPGMPRGPAALDWTFNPPPPTEQGQAGWVIVEACPGHGAQRHGSGYIESKTEYGQPIRYPTLLNLFASENPPASGITVQQPGSGS